MKLKFKPDWFLLGMIAATVLAWAFPSPGAAGGWMHPELLTKAGVALIFFLHGVALSFAALKAGTLRWPLHLLVQSSTFLLFPLLGLLLNFALGDAVAPELKLGLFFLCALPSTVSSSVAMTGVARGNVAGAVFNATLSSLLGVFLTPLWVAFVMQSTGASQPIGPVILDLIRWLVLPLMVGQSCRPWLGAWAQRNKPRISLVDRGTILLLVYTSFCDSFKEGVWSGNSAGQIWLIAGLCAALFALVMVVMARTADALKFSREDRIAAMFCGSKKTLASGVPMAKLIFGAHPGLGLILLPIMIYHPLQLVVCGILAQRWGSGNSFGFTLAFETMSDPAPLSDSGEIKVVVRHNTADHRFEAMIDGFLSVAEYEFVDDTVVFTHTFVPPELRGRGVAEKLVRAALEWARAEKRHVVPACSYIARFIDRHAEFRSLLR